MKKLLAVVSLLVVSVLPVASDALGGPSASAGAVADIWGVDPAHTEINFSVKHFFTPVTGSFRDFEVELEYDQANPEASRVDVRVAIASVDTGNAQRDDHLRSADWFEAERYPYMTFASTSVRRVSATEFVARGPLTVKGVSKEIELPVRLLGSQQIPAEMQGMLGGSKEIVSFNAATTIDRADFGVGVGSWAATLVVGGEVSIEILLEANRK